jgi:prepilin-type N-terminal cleavage/methylation domain-containing protein
MTQYPANMNPQSLRRARSRGRVQGFSLIELMVVIAVVAILSSIAVGAYRNYVMRATRTEGRMALLAIQVAQEKFFLQNNQYAQNLATVIAAPPAGLGVNLTAGGLTSNANYTLSFAAATATTYTLQAVATGPQSHDDPLCVTFTINEQGARTPLDSTGCWR